MKSVLKAWPGSTKQSFKGAQAKATPVRLVPSGAPATAKLLLRHTAGRGFFLL